MAPTAAAIVLAGGSGSRMQADINKVYLPIRERDLLEYSVETVERSPTISDVVVVVREEDRTKAEHLIDRVLPAKRTTVAIGGTSRHLSELSGLRALADRIDAGAIDVVAIHDGARPFMTFDLLEEVVGVARRHGGAVPGLEITEPLYRAEGGGVAMLPGERLRRVQTPQAFRAPELLAAYEASVADGFEGVDTAEAVERYTDLDVHVIEGDPRNIKVTFVEDFFAAEEYALEWSKGSWVPRR